jgi:hypothetical protein
MVILERFPENMGNIVLGYSKGVSVLTAIELIAFYFVIVIIIHAWATGISLIRPRLVQKFLGAIVDPIKLILFHKAISKQKFNRSDISLFFRINGIPPDTKEYRKYFDNQFIDWKLKIFGLVKYPLEISLKDLRDKKEQTQITEHSCIQGWTAIAEWKGIPMIDLIQQVIPLSAARYVVFRSYQQDHGSEFYEVLDLDLVKHPQTILAYEMNGNSLDVGHGAPIRLRCETQLGYKMVKWIKSIEFVDDFSNIGMGQGGSREDHMYYGRGAGI